MYRIGEMIRMIRLEHGISQEELADGICTASNLSKMENHLLIPSRSTFEALMQKLEQPYDIYPVIMDEENEKIYQLRYNIRNYIVDKEYIKARELLDELEKEDDLDYLFKQFVLFAESILIEEIKNDLKEAQEGYQKALRMTLKEFKPVKILFHLLTVEEINLIYHIARCNYRLGNKDEAIVIAYALIEFFEKKIIHIKTNIDIYVLVLNSLSGWLNDIGNYQKSILISDKGIDSCKKYSELRTLPYFVYHKGCSLYQINQISGATEHILYAYYIFRAIMDDEGLSMVNEYMEVIGLQIDE